MQMETLYEIYKKIKLKLPEASDFRIRKWIFLSHNISPYVYSIEYPESCIPKGTLNAWKEERKEIFTEYLSWGLMLCMCISYYLIQASHSLLGFLWLLTIFQMKCDTGCPFLQGFGH